MTSDSTGARLQAGIKTAALAGARVLGDLLILGLWVVFLVLVFLGTGWPRWGFYLLLVAGAVVYVQVTVDWMGSSADAKPE